MKKEKGMYGYLNQKKMSTLFKIVINLAAVIGVYAAGRLLTSVKNIYFILTAVLLVIPLAFFVTGLITLWPWKSVSDERHRELSAATGDGKTAVIAWDLVLTVAQKQLYAGAVLFSRREVVVYTEGKMNLQQRRNELAEMLRGTGYFTGVYLTDQWDSFMARVKADIKADGAMENKDELYKQKERLLIYSV